MTAADEDYSLHDLGWSVFMRVLTYILQWSAQTHPGLPR